MFLSSLLAFDWSARIIGRHEEARNKQRKVCMKRRWTGEKRAFVMKTPNELSNTNTSYYLYVQIDRKQFCQAIDPREISDRSEEHTSELQSRRNLVCRLLLEKKKK